MFLVKRGSIYYVEYFDEITQKIKRATTKKNNKSEAMKFISDFQINLKKRNTTKKISFQDFMKEYIHFAEQTFSDNYNRSIKLSFKMLGEFLDNPMLQNIGSRKVENFLMFIHRRAKYSAELYHRTLKASFSKAIDWGYIDFNPFSKIKLPKKIKRIPIYIDEQELNIILGSTNNEVLKNIFITAFFTGMRQSELLNLKWDSVNFAREIITVKNTAEFTTKSKKERAIPMHKTVSQLMGKLKKSSKSEYIFSNPNNYKFNADYISHKFKKAVRASGLSDAIHFHSLRHSFASNLVRKGVSLYVVKELLGHEDISTTQIYAHLDNAALTNAVNVL